MKDQVSSGDQLYFDMVDVWTAFCSINKPCKITFINWIKFQLESIYDWDIKFITQNSQLYEYSADIWSGLIINRDDNLNLALDNLLEEINDGIIEREFYHHHFSLFLKDEDLIGVTAL